MRKIKTLSDLNKTIKNIVKTVIIIQLSKNIGNNLTPSQIGVVYPTCVQ